MEKLQKKSIIRLGVNLFRRMNLFRQSEFSALFLKIGFFLFLLQPHQSFSHDLQALSRRENQCQRLHHVRSLFDQMKRSAAQAIAAVKKRRPDYSRRLATLRNNIQSSPNYTSTLDMVTGWVSEASFIELASRAPGLIHLDWIGGQAFKKRKKKRKLSKRKSRETSLTRQIKFPDFLLASFDGDQNLSQGVLTEVKAVSLQKILERGALKRIHLKDRLVKANQQLARGIGFLGHRKNNFTDLEIESKGFTYILLQASMLPSGSLTQGKIAEIKKEVQEALGSSETIDKLTHTQGILIWLETADGFYPLLEWFKDVNDQWGTRVHPVWRQFKKGIDPSPHPDEIPRRAA